MFKHEDIVILLQKFIPEYQVYCLDADANGKEKLSIEEFYYKEFLQDYTIDNGLV